MKRALRWFFQNRETGAITVGQVPNLTLWVFIAAAVLQWTLHPEGRWGTVLAVISKGALLLWALDELLRGVNPWRRCLGAGVLLAGLLTLPR